MIYTDNQSMADLSLQSYSQLSYGIDAFWKQQAKLLGEPPRLETWLSIPIGC